MKGTNNAISKTAIISENCTLNGMVVRDRTKINEYVNAYGSEIGSDCMVATFVEIQKGVVVGDNTRIQSHSFICEGTRIGRNCFLAHGIMTINDRFEDDKVHYNSEDWGKLEIGNNVRIGSGCVLFPVKIGENSIIGAGSVVIHDVPDNSVAFGNPAKVVRYLK